ncbi:hypothetical protein, partial [Schleiferia thermophila]
FQKNAWKPSRILPSASSIKTANQKRNNKRSVSQGRFFMGNVLPLCEGGVLSTKLDTKNRTSIIRKNCQPKHVTPPDAKPMLAAGVL